MILWHRPFHELILNSKAVAMWVLPKRKQKDISRISIGLFSEYGAKAVLLPKLMPLILTEERYAFGMDNFVELLHIVGVTSAMDMGIGVFGDPESEIKLI